MTKKTQTELDEIEALKIGEILGNTNIVELNYTFDDMSKTRLHWVTEDQGDKYEHTIIHGWVR